MTTRTPRPLRRGLIAVIAVAVVGLAVVVTSQIGTLLPGGAAASTASPGAAPSPSAPPPTSSVGQTPAPTPTQPGPTPTPLFPAPLDGRLVTEAESRYHPIAVMVDDHADARPQAGFNAASVVWHAPAEGGVPRYMLFFQEQIPSDVGPIRSARVYYVEWASEWNAMFVHHGGSPQALATLRRRGNGSWVWNADGFRWEGRYVFRAANRFAPHNVVTDGEHLRDLAARIGADDAQLKPVWRFAPDAPRADRPDGGTITVLYPYEKVTYRYDAKGNRYVRYVDGSKKPQVDAADGSPVAPKNVVILRMVFEPLNDGHPEKMRVEAHNVGQGEAWIATNGRTVKGTWRKDSQTAPTRLFGPDGNEITLTVGQTFVQVIARSYSFTIKDKAVAPATAPTGSPLP